MPTMVQAGVYSADARITSNAVKATSSIDGADKRHGEDARRRRSTIS